MKIRLSEPLSSGPYAQMLSAEMKQVISTLNGKTVEFEELAAVMQEKFGGRYELPRGHDHIAYWRGGTVFRLMSYSVASDSAEAISVRAALGEEVVSKAEGVDVTVFGNYEARAQAHIAGTGLPGKKPKKDFNN